MIHFLHRVFHNMGIQATMSLAEGQYAIAMTNCDWLRAKRLRKVIDDLKEQMI